MTESPNSNPPPDGALCIIAGRGAYPLELARAARRRNSLPVRAVAFRGETERSIEKLCDSVRWIYVGQLAALLEAIAASGAPQAVMCGQIKPTHLFRVRPDRAMWDLLKGLRIRNAETIFGAVADEIRKLGVAVSPAHLFMEESMPAAGLLGLRPPDERERSDIDFGFRVAKAVSGLDIGQTVVVKEGTVLAVEAFEGTNAAIERAARLGGPGAVVVKVAKQGHDMRFDIPVVGLHTLKVIRKGRVSALAMEAGRTIVLERDKVVAEANRLNLCLVAVSPPNGTPGCRTPDPEPRTLNPNSPPSP